MLRICLLRLGSSFSGAPRGGSGFELLHQLALLGIPGVGGTLIAYQTLEHVHIHRHDFGLRR